MSQTIHSRTAWLTPLVVQITGNMVVCHYGHPGVAVGRMTLHPAGLPERVEPGEVYQQSAAWVWPCDEAVIGLMEPEAMAIRAALVGHPVASSALPELAEARARRLAALADVDARVCALDAAWATIAATMRETTGTMEDPGETTADWEVVDTYVHRRRQMIREQAIMRRARAMMCPALERETRDFLAFGQH